LTNTPSPCGSIASIDGLSARLARLAASYGVRVSRIGASCAPFGTTITV
jgi:hypothetical protein